MSPFVSGALGAVAVLFLAGLVRRAVRHRHLRFREGGASWLIHRLSVRLGARPEQEKVLSSEAGALAEELRALRQDGRALRAEVAELLGGPALDAQAISRALEPRLERLRALRGRVAEALARVHAALDPAQRAKLAELLSHGPRRRGPYACCA
ncbi:MAG TPA: periplasmic heavy metal sensor [Anaeromyxobacter sp.]|nr:periplasmic heavy metal sensor [Anaeromyxobacter sp.]